MGRNYENFFQEPYSRGGVPQFASEAARIVPQVANVMTNLQVPAAKDADAASSITTHVSESSGLSSIPSRAPIVTSRISEAKVLPVTNENSVPRRGTKRGLTASSPTQTGSTQSTIKPPQGKKKKNCKYCC